jgi:hypothetical protein
MNFLLNIGRFLIYSVAGLAIRKTWSWFTADIDPRPGTKEFDIEYSNVKRRYYKLTKDKEEYNETIRKVR